jgi:hypothetical protein
MRGFVEFAPLIGLEHQISESHRFVGIIVGSLIVQFVKILSLESGPVLGVKTEMSVQLAANLATGDSFVSRRLRNLKWLTRIFVLTVAIALARLPTVSFQECQTIAFMQSIKKASGNLLWYAPRTG